MQNNYLDDECMNSLGEFIKTSQTIEHIDIGNAQMFYEKINMISDFGIEMIKPYFFGNVSLKIFDVQRNRNITNKSISIFLEIVEKSCIESIDFNGTIGDVKKFGVHFLVNKLKNGNLKELSLPNWFVFFMAITTFLKSKQ